MADMYKVKSGKLRLKGDKTHKKRKHKKEKSGESSESSGPTRDVDAELHGDWWAVSEMSEIGGCVSIEMSPQCYVQAMDNGLFIMGPPHDEGEGPAPEEILTALRIDDRRIAIKSGYGKFLTVSADDKVMGRSDAVGSRENWEPLFQDGKLALLGSNQKFLSVDDEDNIVATSNTVGVSEVIKLRSNASRVKIDPNKVKPTEEEGSIKQVEENYVRKFQKFQDHKLRMCDEDRGEIKRAKLEGDLHEALLDRRAKMKADRYCK